MLKKFASFVLSSQEPSTGARPPHYSAARTDVVLLIRRTVRPRGYASGFDSPAALLGMRRVTARRAWAGEKPDLFEHPAWNSPVILDMRMREVTACLQSFPEAG
jgi:hypothetical protein